MMQISNLNVQDRLRATQAAAALRANQAGTAAQPTSVTRQPDSISLSPAARALAATQPAADGAGEVRESRVSALKAAIASGTYAVDSSTLARKLVSYSR